jgi:WD40 repeat protein
MRAFQGHSAEVTAVAWSPDGRRVLTESHDGTARLWEAETGRQSRVFWRDSGPVLSVACRPDGRRVLTGSDDGTVGLWDAETSKVVDWLLRLVRVSLLVKEIHTFQAHPLTVWSVAFSPDGKRVVTGSRDGTARLWDGVTPR